MEKVVLENLSVGGECNLFHHGRAWDYMEKGNFEFYGGNLYGIIGEFGNGGAALSCGITGNTNFNEGKIFIDDIEKSIEYLIGCSWYVGNDLYKYNSKGIFARKPLLMKKTIKEQIEYGVRNMKQELDTYTIQKIFNISNERVDRNIEYVSGERWKASAAIGYANGKKIFCYPWLNSRDIEHLKEQLTNTVKYLLDVGCIVLLPTTKEENIKKICEKGHMIWI